MQAKCLRYKISRSLRLGDFIAPILAARSPRLPGMTLCGPSGWVGFVGADRITSNPARPPIAPTPSRGRGSSICGFRLLVGNGNGNGNADSGGWGFLESRNWIGRRGGELLNARSSSSENRAITSTTPCQERLFVGSPPHFQISGGANFVNPTDRGLVGRSLDQLGIFFDFSGYGEHGVAEHLDLLR